MNKKFLDSIRIRHKMLLSCSILVLFNAILYVIGNADIVKEVGIALALGFLTLSILSVIIIFEMKIK